MGQTVTLELPEELARRASAEADRTHRRLEEVLLEWIDLLANDAPVEALPDDQVLALSDIAMEDNQQDELTALLDAQREGELSRAESTRLDELMTVYRRGMVRKARALKTAVERGLRPALG